jgi:hypothetical protein
MGLPIYRLTLIPVLIRGAGFVAWRYYTPLSDASRDFSNRRPEQQATRLAAPREIDNPTAAPRDASLTPPRPA